MYARVWKAAVLPGKVAEFDAVLKSIVPIWRQFAGFRSLTVLRTGPGEMLEATVISTWETLDALRNSESGAFREAVARALSLCDRHPTLREEEVVVNEFAVPDSSTMTAIH
ncbi:MAG TPA: antibiotic biosynthesis monooxygenase [Candidatus Acidoferrales bacterium]|nr:antibiotic biosynthesis monooxygenase [Candidatus Acidoferrales bacterium]